MLSVGAKVTTYFDPTPVFQDQYRRKMRAGRIASARTRLIARRKIKKRGQRPYGSVKRGAGGRFLKRPTTDVSKPGEPPTDRTGKYKNGILYAYDSRTDSWVIGPRVLGQENTASAFEKGGFIMVKTPKGKMRRAWMEPRPVMGPTAQVAVRYYGGIYAQLQN